jgi:hypothetical protein
MAITGVALSFVAQRTKSTWPGIVGHSFGNLPFFLGLALRASSPNKVVLSFSAAC